ncbi:hypothetical protein WQQ_15410 [Hydrocarboniphaga effusa AP103]|uniref:Uncharacterized protein n=1 Tax=Hydrocarboniphaga effusa AP103 TaxID=1172194 RepID=I7ZHM7_9GAMM|nr:hypothetical protein WQQ_15410 [Hydrocarboniphaga effusa AP103]
MKPQITNGTEQYRALAIWAALQRSCGMKPQITADRALRLRERAHASKELRHEAADHGTLRDSSVGQGRASKELRHEAADHTQVRPCPVGRRTRFKGAAA